MEKKVKITRGVVVSDKMDKGFVVRVDYRITHPRFKKFVMRSKKLMVHDEENKAGMGDIVDIESSRPISKKKRHTLVEIVQKAVE